MADQWVVGINAVRGLLEDEPARIIELKLGPERRDRAIGAIEALARAAGLGVQRVDDAFLRKVAAGAQHQQVAARIRAARELDEADLLALLESNAAPALLLVLDQVTDPHNLGAALRTAWAAGAHAVIVPKDHAAPLTPAARKAAAGGAERVPLVRVTNLARALDKLKEAGVWLYGAAGEASQSLYSLDLRGPVALVLGSEGDGLRRLTRERCDALVRIPMAGGAESLNVSVAAGVCLFEALRQRQA
jgi:23S rRNA (guanosine2251-2'-O)-methyltransferase